MTGPRAGPPRNAVLAREKAAMPADKLARLNELEQAGLTPPALAEKLQSLLAAPDSLAKAASAAKSLGRPDAVALLADLAEKLAAGRTPQEHTGGRP